MDVGQFLKGAGDRRPTKTVYLSPDPDALTAAQLASKARTGGTLADVPDDVEQARTAALKSAWAFTVSTIPSAQWSWLVSQHPPTVEQRSEAKRNGQIIQFNAETFPMAAIAACLGEAVNPDGDVMTFDPPRWNGDRELEVDPSATELTRAAYDLFTLGETTLLWHAALELNGAAGPSGQVQSFVRGSAKTRSGVR